MPKRIQRRRAKGWRAPSTSIYCGRPTIFGNPFVLAGTFRLWLTGEDYRDQFQEQRRLILDKLHLLRGRDLSCWCGSDKDCHVDTLLEIANR